MKLRQKKQTKNMKIWRNNIKQKYKVELTKSEIENLIIGCWVQRGEYCTSYKEEQPFKELIEKLEKIMEEN